MTRALLLDAAVRSTILLLLAALAAGLPRRASAARRHRVWATAFLGLLVLPAASALAPGWALAVLPPPAPTPAAPVVARVENVPRPMLAEPAPATDSEPVAAMLPSAVAPSRREFAAPSRLDPWAMAWGAGAALTALPTVAGLATNARRRRASRPLGGAWSASLDEIRRALGVRRPVDLRIGGGSEIPSTWGVVRPVVLLPAEAESWPEATRRVVLSHELAHIRRGDAAVHLLSRLAVSLFWFQPLAWHALRRMRAECEHACDDMVVASGERPATYAEQLVALARRLRAPRLAEAVAMARRNALEDRVKALFDDARGHAPLGRWPGALLLAAGLAMASLLATAQPARRAAAAPEAPAPAPIAAPVPEDPASTPKPTPTKFPDGPPRRLTGRAVVDADGAPAAGAEVSLWWPPRRDDVDGRMSDSILKTTKAGPDGSFEFDAAPARYRVWATLDDLATSRGLARCVSVVVPEGDEEPKPVELRLKPAVAVTAVVKARADGRPIPGALIEMGWGVFPEVFMADERGVARVFPLDAELWNLRARAEGFAAEARWLNLDNGRDAEVEFLLGPGADLSGVVRDPSGHPVGGVGMSVRVANVPDQYDWIVTDPDGRYVARSVPRDVDLTINLSKEGYTRKDVAIRVEEAERALDLTIEPRPFGGSVAGVVLDHEGRPVAGALVTNPGTSSNETRETRTGPDGTFRLDDLYRGIMRATQVVVRADGFQARRLDVEPGPADRPGRATIALEPGHRIRGRVVDAEGRPLEGVRVAHGDGFNPFGDGGTGTTDADGRFAFAELPPRCPLEFSRAGYSDLRRDDLPLDGPDVVEVRMVPAGVILGRAVDGSGQPLRAFRVRITHSPLRGRDEPSPGLWSTLVEPGQEFRSDDGRFRLGDLPVGAPLLVRVSALGHEDATAERVVVARPGEASEGVYRLAAIDPASVRSYAGRLLRADGKPAAGAELRLVASRPPGEAGRARFNWDVFARLDLDPSIARYAEAVADAEGRFRFSGFPRDASVSLYWRGEGIPPGSSERLDRLDDAAAGALDVTLDPPARVVVSVDRAKRPRFDELRISPRRPEGPTRTASPTPDDPSLFELDDLAAGEQDLYLMGPLEPLPSTPGAFTRRTLDTRRVVLKAGETLRIEIP
ncbi:M56 family metallopeptidase [Paludisphaera sp.]|uniref:M56 family metallopeptidase n=1 Tax=Paludisphaera sp. TaxID=2017432 RepID=UPI00301D207B